MKRQIKLATLVLAVALASLGIWAAMAEPQQPALPTPPAAPAKDAQPVMEAPAKPPGRVRIVTKSREAAAKAQDGVQREVLAELEHLGPMSEVDKAQAIANISYNLGLDEEKLAKQLIDSSDSNRSSIRLSRGSASSEIAPASKRSAAVVTSRRSPASPRPR